MDFLPPVVAKLLADVGEFKAAFGEAKAETEGFQAAQNRMAAGGKVAMAALAVGVAAVGYESVKLASSFDQAMELIHTQAGASQSEVEQLKQKVLALGPAVGIGPEKLAEGLYHIESTGFRGKAALDILAASARLAAMGMADLDTVTFAMSGVMSVGMKDVQNAADATAYLNTIVGMGDMKMEKLAAAIGTGVLPSFKSAGLGMTDFGAALATITDNSTGADEAATRLRMTISLMAHQSGPAATALASIGIVQNQLAEDMRKPNGLLVAVMDLKEHLEKSGKTASQQNAVIMQAFGGGKTSGAILTLLEESDRLKSKYTQLGTSGSRAATMQEAWQQQQKQFAQQLHQLGAAAQSVGVNIGNWIIPKLQAGAEWLSKHTAAAKAAAVVIGSLLVAAMAAWTVAVIANTVAMLANPTTWIILAIIAAVALLAIGIYELVKHWGTVWGFIKRIALDVWHWLVDAWHATLHALEDAATWVKTKIIDPIVSWFDKYLVAPIKFYLSFVVDIWRFAFGFISVIFTDWMNGVHKTWARLQPIIATVKEWLIGFYAWIDATFVRPTISLFHLVMTGVDTAWHGWLSIFDTAKRLLLDFYHWVDRTFIQPFMSLFDQVSGAIGGALRSLKDLSSKAGGMGGTVAHMLGFASGGWVPGPPGAPTPAIVHGGEYVLSRDMISGLRTGGGLTRGGTGGPPVGQGTPPPVHIHNHVYLDGKELHRVMIKPAQRYKNRSGTTGLT